MSEIFYNHFIYGPLTREEYQNMLKDLPNSSSTVIAEYFGFKYNGHGVCLNPNTEEIREGKLSVTLRTAQDKNGLWHIGLDWNAGSCGTSWAVSLGSKRQISFDTEKEARFALLCYVEKYLLSGIKRIQNTCYDYDEEDEDTDRGEKLKANKLKVHNKFLSKVRYYQEIYNNQTLF